MVIYWKVLNGSNWPEEGIPILFRDENDLYYQGEVEEKRITLYYEQLDYPYSYFYRDYCITDRGLWTVDPEYDRIMWERYNNEHIYPSE